MRLTIKRRFFEEMNIPFTPEHVRLGSFLTGRRPCEPQGPMSASEVVISAGLKECGTESSVVGDWLVYSNLLVLFPAAIPVSTGNMLRRGSAAVIPVECYYKRMQTVMGQPLTPTWQPMTSTLSVFGRLHFSLRVMGDGCSSLRSSWTYQQGEAVFLEASVDAPLHLPLLLYVDSCVATLTSDPRSLPSYKFVTKHGCLLDSVWPGSSSKFLPRVGDNRLCFSMQAFHFNRAHGEQVFISCHLKATPKGKARHHLHKACYFNRSTFSWNAVEGDAGLCECCNSDDCFSRPENVRHTPQPQADDQRETVAIAGPLHMLPHAHWTGHQSWKDFQRY
ncbi:zona pellucida sperm-binding protein 3-like [Brachionichthys hirsutus]|uniref:zona pellucida sperm-binding protein 3-like n=1 Tax=Brachionichthys hirsutus TaxID=412623 RepID=UPI003604CE1C